MVSSTQTKHKILIIGLIISFMKACIQVHQKPIVSSNKTIKSINKGKEIFISYGVDYWKSRKNTIKLDK